jgi:hypothetical protein
MSHALAGVLACAMFTTACATQAATHYVRTDGGDAEQCDGSADRSLAEAGNTRQCAWSHPFHALPPGAEPRIRGGDTLRIGPGEYRMGLGAPGSERCHPEFSWDCHVPPVPSGPSQQQPTRITGAAPDGTCGSRPQLWGAERATMVLNLHGSVHVEVACLEITDHASCVENHCHGGQCGGPVQRCERQRAPYGDWSGTGISARDASDVTLRELDIHGLALRGVHAGRVRDWRLQDVRIVGNGWSGWDGDLGEDSSNSGTLHFERIEIGWNGCVEQWPARTMSGCWGQQAGGYGDGLGTAATGGHWVFEAVQVHHNASDGLDLLYLRPGASVQVRRSRLRGNAGNQFKASGRVLLEDSIVRGNCTALAQFGLARGDHCRAGGTAVAIMSANGGRAVLRRNRVEGEGDCLVVVEEGDDDSRVELHGNDLRGGPMWDGSGRLSCGFYAHRSEASLALRDNLFARVRNAQCPEGNRCGD